MYTLFLAHTEVFSDPAYPGQWRVKGAYIEQVAKMTHWEYPEAVERFGRQLEALGIASELQRRGAVEKDLVMVDVYDFEFSPGMTNPYIPQELLERDAFFEAQRELAAAGGSVEEKDDKKKKRKEEWKGYYEYRDDDVEELIGFNQDEEWELLDDDRELDEDDLLMPGDDVWTS